MLRSPSVNYRQAELSDLSQLLELEQRVIETERHFNSSIKAGNATYYDIKHLISDDNSYLIVAEHPGVIIGTGYAQIRTSKASLEHNIHSYLGFIYVSTEFRRQGINKRILDMLIDWSRQKGAHNIYLDVYARNSNAIRA